MKTYIKKIGENYVLVDEGKESPIKVNKTYRDGPLMNLPKNSANRQYLMVKIFEANAKDGIYELALNTKESRKLKNSDGTKTTTTRSFAWPEYLTPEERKVYDDLKEKAIKRATDPAEQLRRQIEALQAKLAKMEAAE